MTSLEMIMSDSSRGPGWTARKWLEGDGSERSALARWPGRAQTEGHARVLARVDALDELDERRLVALALGCAGRLTRLARKRHDVNGDIVLLELLTELDERLFVLAGRERRADEDDEPLPLRLVLPVLQRELSIQEQRTAVSRQIE